MSRQYSQDALVQEKRLPATITPISDRAFLRFHPENNFMDSDVPGTMTSPIVFRASVPDPNIIFKNILVECEFDFTFFNRNGLAIASDNIALRPEILAERMFSTIRLNVNGMGYMSLPLEKTWLYVVNPCVGYFPKDNGCMMPYVKDQEPTFSFEANTSFEERARWFQQYRVDEYNSNNFGDGVTGTKSSYKGVKLCFPLDVGLISSYLRGVPESNGNGTIPFIYDLRLEFYLDESVSAVDSGCKIKEESQPYLARLFQIGQPCGRAVLDKNPAFHCPPIPGMRLHKFSQTFQLAANRRGLDGGNRRIAVPVAQQAALGKLFRKEALLHAPRPPLDGAAWDAGDVELSETYTHNAYMLIGTTADGLYLNNGYHTYLDGAAGVGVHTVVTMVDEVTITAAGICTHISIAVAAFGAGDLVDGIALGDFITVCGSITAPHGFVNPSKYHGTNCLVFAALNRELEMVGQPIGKDDNDAPRDAYDRHANPFRIRDQYCRVLTQGTGHHLRQSASLDPEQYLVDVLFGVPENIEAGEAGNVIGRAAIGANAVLDPIAGFRNSIFCAFDGGLGDAHNWNVISFLGRSWGKQMHHNYREADPQIPALNGLNNLESTCVLYPEFANQGPISCVHGTNRMRVWMKKFPDFRKGDFVRLRTPQTDKILHYALEGKKFSMGAPAAGGQVTWDEIPGGNLPAGDVLYGADQTSANENNSQVRGAWSFREDVSGVYEVGAVVKTLDLCYVDLLVFRDFAGSLGDAADLANVQQSPARRVPVIFSNLYEMTNAQQRFFGGPQVFLERARQEEPIVKITGTFTKNPVLRVEAVTSESMKNSYVLDDQRVEITRVDIGSTQATAQNGNYLGRRLEFDNIFLSESPSKVYMQIVPRDDMLSVEMRTCGIGDCRLDFQDVNVRYMDRNAIPAGSVDDYWLYQVFRRYNDSKLSFDQWQRYRKVLCFTSEELLATQAHVKRVGNIQVSFVPQLSETWKRFIRYHGSEDNFIAESVADKAAGFERRLYRKARDDTEKATRKYLEEEMIYQAQLICVWNNKAIVQSSDGSVQRIENYASDTKPKPSGLDVGVADSGEPGHPSGQNALFSPAEAYERS